MAVLEVLQCLFMVLDSALELLDVLGASFAEGCLGLPVALLALFRSRVYWFTPAFALLLLRVLLGICLGGLELGGRGDRARRTISRGLQLAHGSRHICYAIISHLRAKHPSGLIEGR